MAEDKANGMGRLTFLAGLFSNDESSVLEVSYSVNGGSSWTVIATETVTTASLTTYSYVVNAKGNVRVKFEQKSGKRLNIDDVEITDCVEGSSIDETKVAPWLAYSVKGGLEIDAPKAMEVEVYSVEGVRVYNKMVLPGKTKIQLDKGLYVVVNGDDSKKVVVK